jgi:hypothetical protein
MIRVRCTRCNTSGCRFRPLRGVAGWLGAFHSFPELLDLLEQTGGLDAGHVGVVVLAFEVLTLSAESFGDPV